MRNNQRVLVVSYWTGPAGRVTGLWTRDKLESLVSLGLDVSLVTADPSGLQGLEGNIKTHFALSTSQIDRRLELELFREAGIPLPKPLFSRLQMLFGSWFDIVFERLAGSYSYGKYSWVFAAIPKIIAAVRKENVDAILSLGGPTGGHLSAAVAARLLRRPLIVEFQDPILGSEMSLRPSSKSVLLAIEALILRTSRKFILTSRKALEDTRERHPQLSNKCHLVYPFALPFPPSSGARPADIDEDPQSGSRSLVHLGSLYGTRNLDALFLALDHLYETNQVDQGKIQVVSIGEVVLPNFEDYKLRRDFKNIESVSRETAMENAITADFLVLVQHTDSRSLETVPYKVYDYINARRPVLSLSSNKEVSELLSFGGVSGQSADPSDVGEISRALLQLLSSTESADFSLPEAPLAIKALGMLFEISSSCEKNSCHCRGLSFG